MQVTLENLSGLERKLNVTIPAERIEKEIQKKLQKITSTAKMPGFRPGKVPFAVVQKRYGGPARNEVLENLIRETYTEALKQENLNPAGMPKIDVVTSNPKDAFGYNAIFEVYPEVTLADFSQIKIEKEVSKLSDDDINEMLARLQKERVQWKEIVDVARKSQVGDQLTINFKYKPVDDALVEPKEEKNVKLVLGDRVMWEDFERQLYGVGIGEKKKYTLKFPKTHIEKDLIGKDAEFEVEVQKVCEPILLPLDDEFAKMLGIKEDGLEGLKNEIRKNMEKELQTVLKNSFKTAVMNKLLESNSVEVPNVLVEDELDRLAKSWQERFASYQKTSITFPEFPREEFTKQARRSVSLGLLLSEAVKQNKIEVTQQELRAKVEDLSSVYDDSSKVVDWYFSDRNRLMEIKSFLLEEKVLDFLASKADVVEKEVSYKDAIAKKNN